MTNNIGIKIALGITFPILDFSLAKTCTAIGVPPKEVNEETDLFIFSRFVRFKTLNEYLTIK